LKRAHSEIYNLERKHNKLIVACNGEIDRIKKKNENVVDRLAIQVQESNEKLNDCIATHDFVIKCAEKNVEKKARAQERQHYSKVVASLKHKIEKLSSKVTTLATRTVSAEVKLKQANAQANRSAKCSDNAMEYTTSVKLL
jgi:hypothetical protein